MSSVRYIGIVNVNPFPEVKLIECMIFKSALIPMAAFNLDTFKATTYPSV